MCQVKLSNGLLVHGPQCQSETEAKEKAALFALQRLVTVTKKIVKIVLAHQNVVEFNI